jgi:hypothetical protein
VALAAVDFLARIITAWACRLGGFDALAVDYRRRRTGLASNALAIEHQKMMVQALPQAIIAKAGEPAIGRLVRR